MPRRQQVVAFTSMSLRRAGVANGSFGVDQIATAISAPGRRRSDASPISLPNCGRSTWTASQPTFGKTRDRPIAAGRIRQLSGGLA